MTTKFFLIFLFASWHVKISHSVGWYNENTFSDDAYVLSGSGNNGRGDGLWSNNRNWNTGSVWDVNGVWSKDNRGRTYRLMSNMSNWNTLPTTFNVSFDDISNCSTWQSYKSMFDKTYSDQTEETMRYLIDFSN
jgi:hypothetical protein